MTTATDRRIGTDSARGIKAPCLVATTANITLSGLQTIDGVTLVLGDRVLVRSQTTATQNGIYTANTSAWPRAADFDSERDISEGTMVRVTDGTVWSGAIFRVTNPNPIVIDTTSIAFADDSALTTVSAFMETVLDDTTSNIVLTTLTATRSESNAVAVSILSKFREGISVFDFLTSTQIAEVLARSAASSLTTPIDAAIAAATSAKKRLIFPAGIYSYSGVFQPWNYGGIIGEGRQTEILYTGTGNLIDDSAASWASVIHNFTIEGITIYPDAADATTCINALYSQKWLIYNVDITKNPSTSKRFTTGVKFGKASPAFAAYNIFTHSNLNCLEKGIHLTSDANSCGVEHVHINISNDNTSSAGVYIDDTVTDSNNGNCFYDVSIEGNPYYGYVIGGYGNQIYGGRFESNNSATETVVSLTSTSKENFIIGIMKASGSTASSDAGERNTIMIVGTGTNGKIFSSDRKSVELTRSTLTLHGDSTFGPINIIGIRDIAFADTGDRLSLSVSGTAGVKSMFRAGPGDGTYDCEFYRDSSSLWRTDNSLRIGDGAWNGATLRLGVYYLWIDSTGDLRIKGSAPTGDTDGTVVGTQT